MVNYKILKHIQNRFINIDMIGSVVRNFRDPVDKSVVDKSCFRSEIGNAHLMPIESKGRWIMRN